MTHIPHTSNFARTSGRSDRGGISRQSIPPLLLGFSGGSIFFDVGINYAGIQVRAFDVLIAILLFIPLVRILTSASVPKLRISAFVWLLVLYTAYAFVHTLTLSGFAFSLRESLPLLEGIVFLMLGLFVLRTPNDIKLFLISFLFTTWAASIYNVLYHVLQGVWFNYKDRGPQKLSHAASFVMTILFIRGSPRQRIFFGILALIALTFTLMSGERKGWIAVFVSLCVLGLFDTRGRVQIPRFVTRLVTLTLASVGAGLFLLNLFPESYVSRQIDSLVSAAQFGQESSFRAETTQSNRMRSAITIAAINVVRTYPITGIGVGNFQNYAPIFEASSSSQDIHNEYLRIAAETGLVGLSVFILAISLGLIAAFRGASLAAAANFRSLTFVFCAGATLLAFSATVIAFRATGLVNVIILVIGPMVIGSGMQYYRRRATGHA